jgi:cell division protein FtsQ
MGPGVTDMAVTAPADKRFRRAYLKPARKRPGWASWRWRVLASAVAVVLTGYAGHGAFTGIAGLRIFHVRRVVIHGNHRLSNGEVLALLEGLRGQSILAVNLDRWRGSLMGSQWVADASLRRTLPSTVDVTIQERNPLGIGRIDGALYLVDDRGVVIDEYGPNYGDLDLPIIDGLSSAPGDTHPDTSRAILARRLLDALRTRNMAARVSQIDVSDARNAVVLLDGDPTSVRLGDERFVERLQSYFELAPALRERVSDIDYVDMRFDERVYVGPAHHLTTVAPARGAKPSLENAPKRGRGAQTG